MEESENHLPKGAAFDADHYLRTDDPAEAMEAASELAEAAGMPYCAVADAEGQYVVGPVDEIDILIEGSVLVFAVYDSTGELSAIDEAMFSDDSVPDSRLSHAARSYRSTGRPVANESRAERSATARCWRATHESEIAEYNAAFHAVTEMEVKHHSLFTRRQALHKKKTVMDKDRRRVARNAKNWRLRNKSRGKRYSSLYHGPKTKVKEAAIDAGPAWHDVVVDPDTGNVVREACASEVDAAIEGSTELIIERRRKRRAAAPPAGFTEPHIPVLSGGNNGAVGGL